MNWRDSRGGAAKRILVGMALASLLPLSIYLSFLLFRTSGYTPLGVFGAPVLAKVGDAERVFLLTGQWRQYTTGRGSSRRIITDLYVDLWAVDAKTTLPIWRKRLETERGGGMMDRDILGVDGDTVWLVLHGRLVALSAKDGSVRAAVGRVEAENPELQGKMPTEARYFSFDYRGLAIKSTDARDWRVDPGTFKVRAPDPSAPVVEGPRPPAFIVPDGTRLHQVRGLDVPGFWLGLLTDEEAKTFEENNTIGGLAPETRHKLYGGKATEDTNFFGGYLDYSELKPLPKAPDFLEGGLLREYSTATQLPALWMREPDSVFVLHREKLGEAGKLRLTRVAGPEGNVVWDAALPLTIVQSVMKAESNVILFGKEFIEGDPEITDTIRDSPQRLVSVDLTTGATSQFSYAALETHPPAEPVDVGLK